ncbi:unnamed protein product [Owenia fusiformis]|uniref:Uncharacterized protein n=1 Tax=Owenia fusiformis TaxID=6347 RepID=A0A8S4P0R5_OWEFU|nr:unnamed protein product [Owenia fusiformis]
MSEHNLNKLEFFPPNEEDNKSKSTKNIKIDIEKSPGFKSKTNKVSDIENEHQQEDKDLDKITKLRDNLLTDINAKDKEGFTTDIEEYKKLKAAGIISRLGEPRMCVREETTLLRLAVIAKFDEAATTLLKLSDMETIFKQHTRNQEYIGGTVLHDAIANDMQQIVKLLSEKLTFEDFHCLMACQATGTFFKDYFQGYELPLVIASWVGNFEMAKLLLQIDPHGIYLKDTSGNNLLHSLILMCDEENEDVTNFTTMMYMMIYEAEGGKVALQYMLEMTDNNNQTPMMLAIRKGEFRFVQLILNTVYKETVGKYGPASFVNFDITEIEQYPEISSQSGIVYVGTSSNCKRFPQLLSLQPWDRLLKLRWDAYKWSMLISMLIQLGMLIWFAVVVTITPSNEELADMHNTTQFATNESKELSFLEQLGYFGTFGMAQFIGECLFILYGATGVVFQTTVIFAIIIVLRVKGRLTFGEVFKRMFNPVTGSVMYAIAYLIFSICMVLSFASKVGGLDRSTNTTASICIVCGFLCLTVYYRAIDYTSFFTVTVNKMLFGDVFRFVVIITGYLFGFGTAFYILYKDTVGGPPIDMENYGESIITTYKLMLGLVDLKTMKVEYEGILVAFYVTYTLLMTVMLFNMLIGIMANTINDTAEQKQYLSKLQRLSSILVLEFTQFWSKGFATWAIKKGKLQIKTKMFAGKEQKRLFLQCMEVDHNERFCFSKESTESNVLRRLKTPF